MASVPGVGEPDSNNDREGEESTEEHLESVQPISDDRLVRFSKTKPYVHRAL